MAVITGLIAWRSTRIQNSFESQGWPRPEQETALRQEFSQDLETFQQRIEEALAWRASATREIVRLRDLVEKGVALTAADLEYLHQGGRQYLAIRQSILKLAHKYKHLVDDNTDLQFKPGFGTHLFPTESGKMAKVELDPLDGLGDLLVLQFKLSFAAALILYDNFLVAIWPYNETGKLRSLINFDNNEVNNGLFEISQNYLNPEYRQKVHTAARYFEFEQYWRRQRPEVDEHGYLDTLISGSPTYTAALKDSFTQTSLKSVLHEIVQLSDSLGIFQKESMNIVSGLFGNAVGLVETRKGKLTSLSSQEVERLKAQLRPLDILLEKTPFRLTDKLIPGHFGHVAIWLGGKDDLAKAGLWNDNRLSKYKASIETGHSVLEALRSGVQLSTIEHFLNIDDLAVIRPIGLDEKRSLNYLSKAIDQIGKGYDFNFDVETDKRIVCSELAYVVFPDVPWPVEKAVGRFTISPDNVANIIKLRPTEFEIPILYVDGRRVDQDLGRRFVGLLETR